jgi:hypothetical protein
LFKEPIDAQNFIDERCDMNCLPDGDMLISLTLTAPVLEQDEQDGNLQITYILQGPPQIITGDEQKGELENGLLDIRAVTENAEVTLNTDRIMSVVDISGSTLIVSETEGRFVDWSILDKLNLTNVWITTERGQTIAATPTARVIRGETIYTYDFPKHSPSAP